MADDQKPAGTGSMFDDIFGDLSSLTDPIKKTSKEIGQQVSGIKDFTMKEVNAASTAIKSGVALINGLDSKILQTVSAFKSEALGELNDLLKTLTGGLLDSDDLFNLVSLEDGFKLNISALYDKISSLVGFDITNIKGFIKNFENRLISTLNEITGGYLGLQRSSSGGLLKITRNINDPQTQQMLDTLDRMDVSGYSNTYNDAIHTTLYSTMLDQAVYSGVVDSFKPLVDNFVDSDTANKAITDAMDTSIKNGDAVSLAELYTLLTPDAQTNLNEVYPNGASDLTQYFSLPSYVTPADYDAMGDNLWAMCVALNGENWWKIFTQIEGWVPNMLIGAQFSDDILKVWMDRAEVIPLIACRNKFKEISAKDQFIQDFPSVPLLN